MKALLSCNWFVKLHRQHRNNVAAVLQTLMAQWNQLVKSGEIFSRLHQPMHQNRFDAAFLTFSHYNFSYNPINQ